MTGACETWADHDFGGPRMMEAGRDRARGGFCRYERTCRRCGRTATETQWLGLPSDAASLARLARDLERSDR